MIVVAVLYYYIVGARREKKCWRVPPQDRFGPKRVKRFGKIDPRLCDVPGPSSMYDALVGMS